MNNFKITFQSVSDLVKNLIDLQTKVLEMNNF